MTKRDLLSAEQQKNFDDFYRVYPRHVAKLAAQKAYSKAIGVAKPHEILAGATRYAFKCIRERTETKFIAHPSTWLNQGRWMDDDNQSSDSPATVYIFDPRL
jgi:hypothetical protein